ncbi:CBS domain-containing protein [Imbroritus primus]|uniref:CBS domain-containing protein n=1 Tax=Imbroritus primus TaxID=3058603 RepID=A0ACD3SSV6_9BURK|nr:CBS domain-containing protein [Burkholderiaceae bacterium PBA]HVL09264.1 CBS domain-containing protein [Burkholderiaceae bacterium]
MRVSDILKVKGNTLFTVSPATLLSDCVITMADNDVGSLVVMERGELVGLLTFREIIHILAQRQKEQRQGPTPPVADLRVRHVMNSEPIVINDDMNVIDLRGLMVQHHQRYMPVVRQGTLLGVVSFHDVAKAVHEEQDFENRMLKSYIGDWPVAEAALA